MSHIDTIKAEIKSLEMLKKACKVMGLEFIENQKTYKWYGSEKTYKGYGSEWDDSGKCEHAIKVPGASYELGIIRDKDNPKNYNIVGDFYSRGGLKQIVGNNAWKLTQRYSLEQAKWAAKMQGKPVREKVMGDRIRLVVAMD